MSMYDAKRKTVMSMNLLLSMPQIYLFVYENMQFTAIVALVTNLYQHKSVLCNIVLFYSIFDYYILLNS